MWKGLQERELGGVQPHSYAAWIRSLRQKNIALSNRKDVVVACRSVVNSMQIDPVEARYMLAGFGNGSISVYDILEPTSRDEQLHSDRHEALFSVRQEAPSYVSSVHWYPVDTGIFISGSFDKNVSVWDANTQEVQLQFKMATRVHTLSMSPVATTHMLIATGTADFHVRLCDVRSGAFSHTLSGHRDAVWAVKWSASSEWIVITGGCDGEIRLWDIRRAGCFCVLDQHRSLFGESDPAPETRNPLTQRQHPGLETSSDHSKAHYGAVTALETSRDGHYLLSAGGDSRVRLWDLRNGYNTLVNYESTRVFPHRTTQLAVTGDDPLVFVPSVSSIRVYEMMSGRFLYTLKGHYEPVSCCTYNLQTQELYSGSNDRRILVWDSSFQSEEHTNVLSLENFFHDEDCWSD